MYQVSSKGCSRAYILCVLNRALEYVQMLRVYSQPAAFPFAKDVIENWLLLATGDCSIDLQLELGVIDYFPGDTSTFWTSPLQFITW
jgi:hypothetical protein